MTIERFGERLVMTSSANLRSAAGSIVMASGDVSVPMRGRGVQVPARVGVVTPPPGASTLLQAFRWCRGALGRMSA
jgi:hypothetical protein